MQKILYAMIVLKVFISKLVLKLFPSDNEYKRVIFFNVIQVKLILQKNRVRRPLIEDVKKPVLDQTIDLYFMLRAGESVATSDHIGYALVMAKTNIVY